MEDVVEMIECVSPQHSLVIAIIRGAGRHWGPWKALVLLFFDAFVDETCKRSYLIDDRQHY